MLPKILLITIFVAVRIDYISSKDKLENYLCETDDQVQRSANCLKTWIVPIILIQNRDTNIDETTKLWIKNYFEEKNLSSILIVTADTCPETAAVLMGRQTDVVLPSLYMLKHGKLLPGRSDVTNENVGRAFAFAENHTVAGNNYATFCSEIDRRMKAKAKNLAKEKGKKASSSSEKGKGSNQSAPRGQYASSRWGIQMTDPIIRSSVDQSAPRAVYPVNTGGTVSSMNPLTTPPSTRSFANRPAPRAMNPPPHAFNPAITRTTVPASTSSQQALQAFNPAISWDAPPAIVPLPNNPPLPAEHPVRAYPPVTTWSTPLVSTQGHPIRQEPRLKNLLDTVGQERSQGEDQHHVGGSTTTPSHSQGGSHPEGTNTSKKQRRG